MADFDELALQKHKELKGKLAIRLKDDLDSREKLSIHYTPGVGAVSKHLAGHPERVRDYTWTNNLIAVISDGSAVLGLGNVGPEAALPVMEGKSMLFKHFADIDSIPIVLNVHTADEIVATVKAIAPSFGGINLEDIAAPICFEVEERLKAELTIPVMHDDQHGTAVVTLAGLINACKVTGRELSRSKIVLVGAGASGVAVAKLLYTYAQPEIVSLDSKGIISAERTDLNEQKRELLTFNAHPQDGGSLAEAIKDADIYIGLLGITQPGLLTPDMIKQMNAKPIVISMSNPTPEIMPDQAKAAGVAVMATGRSDFPNQINNALAFPGIFRGALDHRVLKITDEHKIKAAEAIATLVKQPTAERIVPPITDPRLVPAVAAVIR